MLDLPAFADLPHAQRLRQASALRAEIAARLAEHPVAHWFAPLAAAGVPSGAVADLADVADDPHFRARGMVAEVTGSGLHLRQPLRFDGVGWGPTRPAPRLGEHTDEILASLEPRA